MSTTVELTNLRATPLAHPEMTLEAGATKSRVYKQVNADDYSVNYDSLAAFGVAVSEDGTYRPGVVEITAVASLTTETLALVDTDGVGFTVTLPASAGFSDGHKIWIVMRVDGGGDLTVAADGSDTVIGVATQVLTDAGDTLRLELEGTNWKAQTV